MQTHESQEAAELSVMTHMETEDFLMYRELVRAEERIRLGGEEIYNHGFMWWFDEPFPRITYAELRLGLEPRIPFDEAEGLVRRAYRCHFFDQPFEVPSDWLDRIWEPYHGETDEEDW